MAGDVGEDIVEEVAAAAEFGVLDPEVVVGIDDREIGFEDVFVGEGEPVVGGGHRCCLALARPPQRPGVVRVAGGARASV